jgi:hypothetical protein
MRLLSPSVLNEKGKILEMGKMMFPLGRSDLTLSPNSEAGLLRKARYFDAILTVASVTEGHHSPCMFHPLETTSSYRDETAAIEGNGARWLVGARAFAKSLVGEGTCEGGAGGEFERQLCTHTTIM